MDKTKDLPYGNYVKNAGGKVNADTMEVQFESRQTLDGAPIFSESAAQKSKMPKEIIEAMRKTASESTSCLDNVLTEQVMNEAKASRRTVNETKIPQVNNTVAQQIDYSLIRMMIEESMKKYIGSLKKSLINENKGSGLQMMTQKEILLSLSQKMARYLKGN